MPCMHKTCAYENAITFIELCFLALIICRRVLNLVTVISNPPCCFLSLMQPNNYFFLKWWPGSGYSGIQTIRICSISAKKRICLKDNMDRHDKNIFQELAKMYQKSVQNVTILSVNFANFVILYTVCSSCVHYYCMYIHYFQTYL